MNLKSLKIVRFPIKVIRHYRANKQLIALCTHKSPKIQAIGKALSTTLSGASDQEDGLWLERIEQRRSILLSSDKVIEKIDYGAGTPDSDRSVNEMSDGIEISESISKICIGCSKDKFWATLLFNLVRHVKPKSCVELGSCVGISAAYQAAALKLNGGGRLLSLEGSPQVADIARETIDSLDISTYALISVGSFQETLQSALQSAEPVDYLFNDGHHDRAAVLEYFHTALPYLDQDALLIVDDISWSAGMKAAWSEIRQHAQVSCSIDLRQVGIAIISKTNTPQNVEFNIPL